jgi:diaminohydroxyphosphoribosylaminopyrimidine deaminase/5-amino-6-(5-phosphoribosylamino)uracil reductase
MDLINDRIETIAGLRKPEPATDEERLMLRALELAEKGRGSTSPNPMVGAVIGRGGEVLGEGYHEVMGGPHAEVNALANVAGDPAGATMYVTLEPCAYQGRTPPCADRVVDSGIVKVVMAIEDPNPLVSGKGERFLRDRGVEVTIGPYSEIALRQNEAYLKWVTEGLPFVTLKMAMSLDGKVATRTGDSKWISSGISRADVHRIRAVSDAVMVGIGTVVQDNPQLTVRTGEERPNPLRVVVDSLARTPLESEIAHPNEAPTIIAVTDSAPEDSAKALVAQGVEVVRLDDDGKVDLKGLLELLGGRGVTSLLVEGGPELTRAMWEAGLVDKLVFYFAPKVIAGCNAPGPIGGTGVSCIEDADSLAIDAVYVMGPDFKVVAYPGGD